MAPFPHLLWASQVALVVKNLPDTGDTRDLGSIPGLGRPPGGGHSNLLQCSCLENPMDRGAGGLQFMGSQSQTRLSTHTIPPFSLLTGSMSFVIWHCSFSHHQAESESPPLEHEPALLQPKEGSRSGPSLVVQWLRLPAPNAGDWCLIPGQRTKCHKPQLRPGTGLPWWLRGKESIC